MKIAIFIESAENKIHPVSLESLVAAQTLKNDTNGELHGITFDPNLSDTLSTYNLNSLICVNHENLKTYKPLYFLEALNQINANMNPDIFIFGHTYETRDWVPRLSAKLNVPFIPDCTSYKFSENLSLNRPIYQAKLTQTLSLTCEKSIVSFQAGSYSKDNLELGNPTINNFPVDFSSIEDLIQSDEKFQESAGGVDLTAADYIVSVGRGIAKEENIPLAQNLADKINAQIGSSRPVVDAGWLDHSRQIGSSGQVVSPKLYFALGISGAIQHLVGMKGSKKIIAINKDPNAPIFEIADYAVVADLLEIVPKLTDNL